MMSWSSRAIRTRSSRPAISWEARRVYVLQSFDATFTFTPPGGPTFAEHFARSKHNVHGDLVTCTFDITETGPEGTFRGFGTVVAFITPAS